MYQNEGCDLVDAMKADNTAVSKLPKEALPESMRNKSKKEIEVELGKNDKERSAVQKQIAETSVKRNEFLAKERQSKASGSQTKTLQTEIEKIIKMQVQRFNMQVQ